MMHKGSLLGNQRYAPIHEINGYRVKPGKYLRNGATIVEGGVNFTIHSNGAVSRSIPHWKHVFNGGLWA